MLFAFVVQSPRSALFTYDHSCFITLFNHFVFFFKQKTAYEMRISDWSSDVCSSDLPAMPSPSPQGRPPKKYPALPSSPRSPDRSRGSGGSTASGRRDRKSVV